MASISSDRRRHSAPVVPLTTGTTRRSSGPPRLQLKKKVTLVNKFDTVLFGRDVEVKRGCILHDDKLILCGVDNYVYICNADGKRSNRISVQFTPSDIALFDEKRAVVSGEKGYQIIDIETLKAGPLVKPGGICTAVACTKDNIVVANDYCKLTYLTINGETVKSFNTTHSPLTMTGSQDGFIYWTTWDNDEVHYIDPMGTERFFFASPDLQDPVGVSVDKKGDVFVIGHKSNNVHKITHDGNTDKIVLKESNGLKLPSGMAISPKKSELMIINDKKSISIFRIQ
ncbi:Hypothetical predicted protein [Mytilus galloprovincialis]|uniref:Uncharacterized protein n=1 Tax=Mytilus galloprovincialis TaxID=29158 RepID=A0A8B6BHI1_MYTGA|nr:Hypothetical predicted protein [Mytilus galloprovincialis]